MTTLRFTIPMEPVGQMAIAAPVFSVPMGDHDPPDGIRVLPAAECKSRLAMPRQEAAVSGLQIIGQYGGHIGHSPRIPGSGQGPEWLKVELDALFRAPLDTEAIWILKR